MLKVVNLLKVFSSKDLVKKFGITVLIGIAQEMGISIARNAEKIFKRRKLKTVKVVRKQPEFKRTGLPKSYEYYVN